MLLTDTRPVVLITGISAAGKSTVADMLARRFDAAVHIRGDGFRRMITAGRHEMTASPSDEAVAQLRLRYRLGASTSDAYHAAGFAVVVQDVVLGAHLQEYVSAIASRPLVVVVLAPTAEAVAEREISRDKTAYREGFAAITDLDRALRLETPRIGLWVDSSDQRPENTVETIVTRGLAEGLVS